MRYTLCSICFGLMSGWSFFMNYNGYLWCYLCGLCNLLMTYGILKGVCQDSWNMKRRVIDQSLHSRKKKRSTLSVPVQLVKKDSWKMDAESQGWQIQLPTVSNITQIPTLQETEIKTKSVKIPFCREISLKLKRISKRSYRLQRGRAFIITNLITIEWIWLKEWW